MSILSRYGLIFPLVLLLARPVSAQQIDSIHVFKQLPAERYTSASAN
ncbi:MAG: hypothetical protein JST98_13135, partial [Bacteroidetes bacterium]|nr:hypothetical protein [Bacteroidota bacterium]